MRAQKLIMLFVLILATFLANGQDNKNESYFNGLINISEWIKSLDIHFAEFVKDEMRAKCIRELGYLGSDLELLSQQKQDFLLNIAIRNNDESNRCIHEISVSTQDLLSSIHRLNLLINENFGKLGNQSLHMLERDLLYEKLNMHASMLINLRKSELEPLINNTKKAIQLLDEASLLVWSLRGELNNK